MTDLVITGELAGARLDRAIASIPGVGSRSRADQLIAENRVLVDGVPRDRSFRLLSGMMVAVDLPDVEEARGIERDVDVPFEVVLCRATDAPRTRRVVVSGHINEGDDLFAEDYPFPQVEEGDIVAIINVGGYNQAMTMTHCMRPPARAVYFEERITPA